MLRGDRVVLREKRIEDAPDDYAWRKDPELACLDAALPLTMPYSEYLLIYSEELNYRSQRRCRLAVDNLDHKHIGNIMYYDVDEFRGEAELGILIGDRDYWDKGYGVDA